MSELSIWLDAYDDIYSDFDSRNYTKRRISEDFIEELQMALKYRSDLPDSIILYLPAAQRNIAIENGIIVSLKDQIRGRYYTLIGKIRRITLRGVFLLLGGFGLMLGVAFFSLKSEAGNLAIFLKILLEPASWFMLWTGLDLLIFDFRKIKKESVFYNKISQMAIHFKDI